LDSSLRPYHIHPYHFLGKKVLPHPPLFSSPILMAHTRSQDLEAHFNTLHSGLIETQQISETTQCQCRRHQYNHAVLNG
jgi:hypothetical protein